MAEASTPMALWMAISMAAIGTVAVAAKVPPAVLLSAAMMLESVPAAKKGPGMKLSPPASVMLCVYASSNLSISAASLGAVVEASRPASASEKCSNCRVNVF